MGGAISAAYGQSASTAQELQYEFLGRLPIPQRINVLRRILDARDLSGSYAFVVPILNKLFDLRNELAHSVSAGYDQTAREIRLMSMRKGKEELKTFDAPYLHWLLYEQTPVIVRELEELYWIIAPDTEQWHEG